jgi:hypothetical protein
VDVVDVVTQPPRRRAEARRSAVVEVGRMVLSGE